MNGTCDEKEKKKRERREKRERGGREGKNWQTGDEGGNERKGQGLCRNGSLSRMAKLVAFLAESFRKISCPPSPPPPRSSCVSFNVIRRPARADDKTAEWGPVNVSSMVVNTRSELCILEFEIVSLLQLLQRTISGSF